MKIFDSDAIVSASGVLLWTHLLMVPLLIWELHLVTYDVELHIIQSWHPSSSKKSSSHEHFFEGAIPLRIKRAHFLACFVVRDIFAEIYKVAYERTVCSGYQRSVPTASILPRTRHTVVRTHKCYCTRFRFTGATAATPALLHP